MLEKALSSINLEKKSVFSVILLASGLVIMGFGNPHANVLLINLFILCFYILFMPNNVFHPNNIIFAFSFLYVVVPSSVQLVYEIFDIPYLLPWGALYDWFSYELSTYYSVFFLFLTFYLSFYTFNRSDVRLVNVKYIVNKKFLVSLSALTILMLVLYLQATGGLAMWLTSYKEAFLLGRDGKGLLNFIVLFLVNLMVFLLGLYFYEKKGAFKMVILLLSLLLIVSASLLQGFKSRIIILLIIFFFPYLLNLRLSALKLVVFGGVFFAILFVGNYIRSDGYYDSFFVFIEYMMTYFNVYDLHNMVVTKSDPGLFNTMHHIFIKPAIALGFVSPDSDFDISVMLTKEYFPLDWEKMKATQQWPLITELYYNFYGFLLGWFPILVYAFILSILYKEVKRGHVALALIFILEFFRLFTVQRGVLIPWQMPVYLFFYIIIYFSVKWSIKVKDRGNGDA